MNERIVRLKADTDWLPPQYRDNTDNDMAMIVYLPDTPVIEGEDNYQQQLVAMQIRRIVRTIIGKSTLLTPISPAATGNANELLLHTVNQPFHVAVDGIVKTVYSYDTPTSGTKIEGGNRITLPDWDADGRKDLVYLEIWFEEVMATDAIGTADTTIYKHGMVHGFTDVNNIKVVSYSELSETTRRVQLRGKIKSVANATTIVGVGAKDSVAFTFSDRGGFLAAGNGDISSAQSLGTVDGYVYAIPLVSVTRGVNSSAMTASVVAPAAATLQQLASSTLKDVAQFGTDIQNLLNYQSTSQQRITELQTANTQLASANTALASQLTVATDRVTALEQQTLTKRIVVNMDTRNLIKNNVLTSVSSTFGSGMWFTNHKVVTLPRGYHLKIGDVFASMMEENGSFSLRIRNNTTGLTNTWSWIPRANGLSYNYSWSGYQLTRDTPAQHIDLPSYRSTTRDQSLTIFVGVTVAVAQRALIKDYDTGSVEIVMTPG